MHNRTLFLALALFALAGPTLAADWDPAHAVSGNGSGGSGTWYPSSANWYPGSGSADQVFTPGAAALFAGNGFSVAMLARGIDKARQGLAKAKQAVRSDVLEMNSGAMKAMGY